MTVFVFGSNLRGVHGAGAARYAVEYEGAQMGVGEGLQGNAYALPTKDYNIRTLPLSEIEKHIDKFLEFARSQEGELEFALTPIGTGLAGHKIIDMLNILKDRDIPKNVLFTKQWFGFE